MKINIGRLTNFWSYVVDEEIGRGKYSSCWVWIGAADALYPRFSTVTAQQAAGTIYCEALTGKCRHKCGNKLCMRLEHLSISYKKEPERVSEFTGKPIPLPKHLQPEIIRAVLDSRKIDFLNQENRKINKNTSSLDAITAKYHVGYSTAQKILRLAPVYDLLSEIAALKEAKKEVCKKPYKKFSQLVGTDLAMYYGTIGKYGLESIDKIKLEKSECISHEKEKV